MFSISNKIQLALRQISTKRWLKEWHRSDHGIYYWRLTNFKKHTGVQKCVASTQLAKALFQKNKCWVKISTYKFLLLEIVTSEFIAKKKRKKSCYEEHEEKSGHLKPTDW